MRTGTAGRGSATTAPFQIYRYSAWSDGTEPGQITADAVLDALSEDLLADGDLWSALQRIMRWGLRSPDEPVAGAVIPGLQDLLQQIKDQKQAELARYDLESVMRDVVERLQQVVEGERAAMEARLEDARRSQHGATGDASQPEGAGSTPDELEMLESIVRTKQRLLDELPIDPAALMRALQDYEFLSAGAREEFGELLRTLQNHALERYIDGVEQSLCEMTTEDRGRLLDMVHDLNDTLRQRLRGQPLDFDAFDAFKAKHPGYFPGAESFDDVVSTMRNQMNLAQSFLDSMSAAARDQLQSVLDEALGDTELRGELGRLAAAVEYLLPMHRGDGLTAGSYPFTGHESIPLDQALELFERVRRMERVEHDVRRAHDAGDVTELDFAEIGATMGDGARQTVEQLSALTKALADAGYVDGVGAACELTPRGIRRIGHKALVDIFARLKTDTFGAHASPRRGSGATPGNEPHDTKPYEFGQPLWLDLPQTLMNSIRRQGPGSPLSIHHDDFEVYQPEYTTHASTVLMLDMSRSMPLRGCFVAAKKVAIALNSLIRTQFPRDTLYVIGFSDFAQQLTAESLYRINWGDYDYGTNMQHGFMMARRLLARHRSSNRQIILITDGEPTAHFEGGHVHFSYPPSYRTFQETLREVKRCTAERIVINTFMLERSHYLTDFVNQMTSLNRGRAFFATPERLGQYVLVDYVTSKRTMLGP